MDGTTMSTDLLGEVRETLEFPPPKAAEALLEKFSTNEAYDLVLAAIFELMNDEPYADVTGHVEVLQILDPVYQRTGVRSEEGVDGLRSYCPAGRISADHVHGHQRVLRPRWIVVDKSTVSSDVMTALDKVVDDWPWWRILWDVKGFARKVAEAVEARTQPWRVYERVPASDHLLDEATGSLR